MGIVEILKPDIAKIIFFLAFGILFWFFPIFTSSLFAFPFFSMEINYLSIFNFIIAYVFSSLIVHYSQRKIVGIGIIFLIAMLILVFPKVASYGVGDFGWYQKNYCNCMGTIMKYTSCCSSVVEYCIGPCFRNETINSLFGNS